MQGEFPHSSPDALAEDTEARREVEQGVGAPKRAKEEVNYRDAGSSKTRCGTCTHFSPGLAGNKGSCDLVLGAVSTSAVCDLYNGENQSMMDLVQ